MGKIVCGGQEHKIEEVSEMTPSMGFGRLGFINGCLLRRVYPLLVVVAKTILSGFSLLTLSLSLIQHFNSPIKLNFIREI